VQRGPISRYAPLRKDFRRKKVILYWKEQKAGSWETMEMRPDAEGVAFGGLFANLVELADLLCRSDGYNPLLPASRWRISPESLRSI